MTLLAALLIGLAVSWLERWAARDGNVLVVWICRGAMLSALAFVVATAVVGAW